MNLLDAAKFVTGLTVGAFTSYTAIYNSVSENKTDLGIKSEQLTNLTKSVERIDEKDKEQDKFLIKIDDKLDTILFRMR